MESSINEIINAFSKQNEVLAIALGGSHTTGKADNMSDYDIYVYANENLDNNIRQNILEPYCGYFEIGNNYWELEDNCNLNNGIFVDIIYRNFYQFTQTISDVVENGLSRNGYTTCLWHNLLTCEILYDKANMLTEIKRRFSIPYPQRLKSSIIKRNMNIITDSIASYDKQIEKSIKRQDFININNRIVVFLDSYFDIIFALNETQNTGEKRIIENCLEKCKILPNGFEENIKILFYYLNTDINKVNETIKIIIIELKKVINNSNVV